MVHNERNAFERSGLLLPALHRRPPTFAEIVRAYPVELRVGVIDLCQPPAEHLADFGDVAGIEMDMRVARRMDIAERAVDHLRDLEPYHELRCLDEARGARLDAVVARLREEQRQPADFQL